MAVFLGMLATATSIPAMDRWEALSMFESGNNDHAIGRLGEISRFQIRRELWPGGNPHDVRVALSAARNIMEVRLGKFRASHKREVTDFEFYVLWNAPWQVNRPSAVVSERARRFENLVQAASSLASR